jgi:tetratricopeptide (TPR) repeat protein
VVLWLENADLAMLSQLSGRLLDELPTGFRIFMTLDGGLIDAGVLPGVVAEVLNAPGVCVRLGLVTDKERGRLAVEPAYADIAVAHEGEPVLMGRLMVSLERIIDALETPDEGALCRVAVLHAAVDWQRAAVPVPLTREVVMKLYRGGYWHEESGRGRGVAASRSRFRQAIKDLLASAPGLGLWLLDEVYSGSVTHLRPHPLLPVVADSPQRPPGWEISESLWNYLTEALNGQQRLNVGLSACSRGDYRHARRLLDSLDTVTIPAEIVYGIAIDADEAGETTAARAWYGNAIASGHADIAPKALVRLGLLDKQQGRIDEAHALYAQAIATGHPDAVPEAMFDLGVLDREQGHIKEARAWYIKAIASGHTDFAPAAMLNLGLLENEQGRIKEARALYAKAVASGHAFTAPVAMLDLGRLETGQRRMKQGRSWFAKAIATGHPDAVPAAMADLGFLDERQGRIDEARALYARVIATGHPDAAPKVMFRSGLLEHELGRIEEARGLYAKAVASGHADVAPQAMVNLGSLEHGLGRIEEARGLYARTVASGHAYAAPRAMLNLALIEMEQGRIEEARLWSAKVIESGDADQAPKAMFNLGNLEEGLGHFEKAHSWYAMALASGHPRAHGRLDQLRRHHEDLQRAENFAKYGSPYTDTDHDG